MRNELKYVLNINRPTLNKERCKQLDIRPMELSIYNFNDPYDLTDVTLELRAKKPDGSFVIQSNNMNIEGNTIKINPIDIDIVRIPGDVKLELKIIASDSTISTFTFKLEVLDGVIQDGDNESSNVITEVERLNNKITETINKINEVNTVIGEIEQAETDLNNIIQNGSNQLTNQVTQAETYFNSIAIGATSDFNTLKTGVTTDFNNLTATATTSFNSLTSNATANFNVVVNGATTSINNHKDSAGVTYLQTQISNLTTVTSPYYEKCISSDSGALLVVNSGSTTSQINLASVTPAKTGYTPVVGDYVRYVYGSNAEIVQARGTFSNLNGRLDGINATLGNTVTQGTNLINPNGFLSGWYNVDANNNLTFGANVNYLTQKIPVKPNTTYYIDRIGFRMIQLGQDGTTVISAGSTFSDTPNVVKTTLANVYFITIQSTVTSKTTIMIEGTSNPGYIPDYCGNYRVTDKVFLNNTQINQVIDKVVTKGSGAPTTNSNYIGQIYIDTTNKIAYISINTGTGVLDWKKITIL